MGFYNKRNHRPGKRHPDLTPRFPEEEIDETCAQIKAQLDAREIVLQKIRLADRGNETILQDVFTEFEERGQRIQEYIEEYQGDGEGLAELTKTRDNQDDECRMRRGAWLSSPGTMLQSESGQ
jgi:hypothetical protein